MRKYLLSGIVALWLGCLSFGQIREKPNIIIILADDLGYGDVGCYGSSNILTPHLDRMAAEGIRFTSFYTAPFCGASRAALMTGCYAPRVSLSFNHGPKSVTGIHPDEITIAELLHKQGYATMHIGKWHLGDHPQFLPTRHGFDRYFGLPYSNDMWPFHPRMPVTENEDPRLTAARRRATLTGFAGEGTFYPKGGGFTQPLPLMSDEEVVELNPDQTRLTAWYTEKALEFINTNKDRPFFLYLAQAMPHVPLFVSARFKDHSERGLYGDAVEEIDWSVGQILGRLRELRIDDNTLVIFTSDNGPWLEYGIDGGSAGPLRGGKGTAWEGGVRVPAIMRWPTQINPGTRTNEMAGLIDLLPTLAALVGTSAPSDRVIDGGNIWPLISGQPATKSPHELLFYFHANSPQEPPALMAVRDRQWKLHLTMQDGRLRGTELYDLQGDVGERNNQMKRYPEIAQRLETGAQDFYDLLKQNIRPLGYVK